MVFLRDGGPVTVRRVMQRHEQTPVCNLAVRGLLQKARRADRPAPELVVAMPVGTRLDRLLAEVR